MKPFALQARYVIPLDGRPPIAGGIVSIAGERIIAVGENIAGNAPRDLGNVALLPGLVNAHTHLEFSLLKQPLGKPGQSLPEWIRDVLSSRRQATSNSAEQRPEAAVLQGIRECLASGTTTIGEIATHAVALASYAEPGAEITIFSELLGLPEQRLPELKSRAEAHARQLAAGSAKLRAGLSPHAPYSVHPELVRWAAEYSNSNSVSESASAATPSLPIAMHLAESPEELELLASGSGPFVDLLRERGVWTPESLLPAARPLDYLRMLSRASRALVIHGNYLRPDELEFLAAHRTQMALVYCPRTHAYFGHAPYPLRQALDLGVAMAWGTDSRASNPDLSLLAEMRFVAGQYPDISPETILWTGTSGGAQALGLERERGTLTVGKFANLTAISIPNNRWNPYEQVLQGRGETRETWCRGKSVFQSN